jgi:hypothetical protein
MELNKQNPLFFDYISLILFISALILFYVPAIISRIFLDDVGSGSSSFILFLFFGSLIVASILVIIFSIINNRIRWWRVALFAFEAIILFGWILGAVYIINTGTSG